MSKTLVIVTHPNIEQSHVNKSWVDALKAHPDLYTVHEIYKLYPDGKIDVAAEQKLLESYGQHRPAVPDVLVQLSRTPEAVAG